MYAENSLQDVVEVTCTPQVPPERLLRRRRTSKWQKLYDLMDEMEPGIWYRFEVPGSVLSNAYSSVRMYAHRILGYKSSIKTDKSTLPDIGTLYIMLTEKSTAPTAGGK